MFLDVLPHPRICFDGVPDLLPHGRTCPYSRGPFYSLPRNSRYDAGPATHLFLSNTTERLRTRRHPVNCPSHFQETVRRSSIDERDCPATLMTSSSSESSEISEEGEVMLRRSDNLT